MTPSELKSFLDNAKEKPSMMARAAKIDLQRLEAFLAGDESAITDVEQSSLDRFIVDENNVEAARAETHFIYDAMGDHVRKHSVAFLSAKEDVQEIASGTLIEIGDKIFVATAGHTVPKNAQMLEFMGDNTIRAEASVDSAGKITQWRGQRDIAVLNGKKHPHFDVGFIEIARTGLGTLQRTAIDLSRISVRDVQYGRLAFVFGYPSELKKERKFRKGVEEMRFASITYASGVMAPSEWPIIPSDNTPPNPEVDCFIRYSQDDNMKIAPIGNPHSGISGYLPKVFGVSGGGFWQSWKVNAGKLWFPSDYQLFAIQSSWYEKGNYLRAIRIRHWLDLIAESYPDLKVSIEEHIASQQQSSM